MRSVALVKTDNSLRNPQPSLTELQNADLSRPSAEQREKNLAQTRADLGMKVQSKTENSFLYAQALKKREEDKFIRYTPTTAN